MLLRIIKSELKKIFKLKFNIILIIIAILGPMLMSGSHYFNFTDGFAEEAQSESGETLSGLSFLKYVDKVRHQYAGEWNEELSQKYQQDYQSIYNQYNKEIIDERRMEAEYGPRYQELIQKDKDKTLLYKDIHEYKVNAGLSDDDYEPAFANEIAYLNIYFQDVPKVNTIQYAYGISEIQFETLNNMFSSLSQYMKDKKVNFDDDIESLQEYSHFNEKELQMIFSYLQDQALSTSSYFDSTIPNQVMLENLNNTLWIPLICISIILANTFGMEKQYNMEQLIHPTKASKYKITIAKLMTGTLFSLSIMMLSMLGCILIGYILLPVHSWDVAAFGTIFCLFNPTYTIAYSYQTILLTTLSLAIIASLAVSTLTLGLSYLFKNKFYVVILLFLYFGMSIFLNLSAISQWLQYTHPYIMTHIFSYINTYTLAYSIMNQQVIPQSLIAIIFWVIITILVYALIIFRSKQKKTMTI